MRNFKHILITGASSGFGRLIAERALEAGHFVIATARRPELLETLKEKHGPKVMTLALDVTDRSRVQQAIESVIEKTGHIDVLVNNAGFGYIGAIEEFSEEEARQQMETNLFGPLWLTQAVLPYMRSHRAGHIINISSVAGFVGYPGSGLYATSKHALEGMSQGLAREVESLGIKVSVVNPGPFRTNFAGGSLQLASKQIEDYAESVHARQASMKTKMHGNQPGDPAKAADAILALIEMDNPPFTLPLGSVAYEEIPNRLKKTLGEIEAHRELGLHTDFSAAEPSHR